MKNGQGDAPVDETVKLGRPLLEDRNELVLNNGFSKRQWEWFKREAKAKGMSTMTYIRTYPAQWWIDGVEAARAGTVATPEDDHKFEKFVSDTKSNHKRTRRK